MQSFTFRVQGSGLPIQISGLVALRSKVQDLKFELVRFAMCLALGFNNPKQQTQLNNKNTRAA